MLINNDTHQRETVSEGPIRPPLRILKNIMSYIYTGGSIITQGETNKQTKKTCK